MDCIHIIIGARWLLTQNKEITKMKIIKIELQTNNIQATEKFYTEVLELKGFDRKPETISFQAGHSILSFNESPFTNSKYHFAFNIPQNKLKEAIQWISPKTELIKNSDDSVTTRFEDWNAESIYFYDNNGNILEFISRFDLNNASDQTFDSTSILSVSEMGIVSDKPLVLAEELTKIKDLDYFVKGPKRKDFVAVGDEQGLLVISSPKRNWFPTNNPAEKHPLKISILVNDSIELLEFVH